MDNGAKSQRLHVLLISEGTYPFFFGGVSTWCHVLLRGLPEVDFTVMSLIDDPYRKPTFELSSNVVEFRTVPVWGSRQVSELDRRLPLKDLISRKQVKRDALERDFLPAFETCVRELFTEDSDPKRLASSLHRMYRFFLSHDFDATMSAHEVWECFAQIAHDQFPNLAKQHGFEDASYSIHDITAGAHWLRHMLIPLAKPLPKVDVAQAAMAGMCTLIGVVAKMEHGAAFLLTEHGIYLRESYLAEAGKTDSLFMKFLRLRFARCMTELSYAMADQISPCCDYNQRWERAMGASDAQLQTIYYGLDAEKFTPEWKPIEGPPTIIWVGRINPLKDLATLLQAAQLVHRSIPNAQFHLFGTPPVGDEKYLEQLLAMRHDLELDNTVIFRGFTSLSAQAFNQGDLAVLSSISEGFPYVIVEAMLCGKPVVATGVGGVPEQIKDCGVIVEPRNPQAMADAIVALLNDPQTCLALGQAARARAEQDFTTQKANEAYLLTYQRLARAAKQSSPPPFESSEGEYADEVHNEVMTGQVPSLAMS